MPDWRLLAKQAAETVSTPCYLVSELCIRQALTRLKALESSIPLRHWVSLKSQPLPRMVQTATELDLGIDVVSECELLGVLAVGVPARRILVNGVGKHTWLSRHRVPGLHVHLDSLAEVRALARLAKAIDWSIGLRCAIPEAADPELAPSNLVWDQFGMTELEIRAATRILADAGVAVRGIHFHLHTNVRTVESYRRALTGVAAVVEACGLNPKYVDIGGGLPVAGEASLDGTSAATTFDLDEFRDLLASVPSILPSVREVWLENGRFLTGPAGALVMSILDKKERGDAVYLICDGGRVNHARMASMERHDIMLVSQGNAPIRKTFVCGPTCSAVDRLGCWELPGSAEPGDLVIWLNAGAYHIPLETRFSSGLAPVVWFNDQVQPEVIRTRETAAEWWGHWVSPGLAGNDAAHDRSRRSRIAQR